MMLATPRNACSLATAHSLRELELAPRARSAPLRELGLARSASSLRSALLARNASLATPRSLRLARLFRKLARSLQYYYLNLGFYCILACSLG